MASQKVSAMTEETSPALTDVMYLVHDAATTPLPRKVQIGNLRSVLSILDKEFTVIVVAPTTDCAVGNSAIEFPIPTRLNNHNLTGVTAWVNTAGTTGTMDIQIRNQTDTTDMLSTKITIDSTEISSLTAATAAVVDTTHDDVVTNDIIAVDIDVVQTTKAKGLYIKFKFSPQ